MSLTPLRKTKNSNFFLLVDQFEELFRFSMKQKEASYKTEAIDFVNTILSLSTQKEIPFYVVLTMRSDFIGDCAQFYGLPEALNKSQYLVPRLNRLELKKIIEGPAKLYGGRFNPALTSRLINDLGKIQDELPLVQHALMRMWDSNAEKNTELDLEVYKGIGGIENALSKHADEALKELKADEEPLAKALFQALTTIDENGRKIRRPAKLSYLKKLTGASEEKLLHIINNFIKDNRSFLVVDNIGDSDDKLIDISHESLIRHWKTLEIWVEEESKAATHYMRLCDAYIEHTENRKDLLAGREFEISQEWFESFKPSKIWAERFNESLEERYKDSFDESMKYLSDSARVYNIKKRNARRIKRIKKAAIYSVVGLAFLGILYYFALPNEDEKAWNVANNENNIQGYEAYLDKYPRGTYALYAQDSLESMKYVDNLNQAWDDAKKQNSVKAYENYLNLAATEKDSTNKILEYSNKAKEIQAALKKIDSLKIEGSNSKLDDSKWIIATDENTVSSYLDYYRNEMITGKHDKEALERIFDKGHTGFLYCGKVSGTKINDRIFDLIYRNESGFQKEDMLRTNDIVRALKPRYIYNDLSVTQKSGHTLEVGQIYFIKSVVLQANAIFVEIIY